MEEDSASKLLGKVLVVGVGSDDHGDDAAGSLIARRIPGAMDSGASPECDTWRIREIRPDTVLFIDAVDFGGKPGDLALLESRDLRSEGFDTHRAPLKLTMEYLEQELSCKCLVLAVQPRDVRQGAQMCEEVVSAVGHIEEMLRRPVTAGRMK